MLALAIVVNVVWLVLLAYGLVSLVFLNRAPAPSGWLRPFTGRPAAVAVFVMAVANGAAAVPDDFAPATWRFWLALFLVGIMLWIVYDAIAAFRRRAETVRARRAAKAGTGMSVRHAARTLVTFTYPTLIHMQPSHADAITRAAVDFRTDANALINEAVSRLHGVRSEAFRAQRVAVDVLAAHHELRPPQIMPPSPSRNGAPVTGLR